MSDFSLPNKFMDDERARKNFEALEKEAKTHTHDYAAATQEAWVAPTFANSWANYGSPQPVVGYMKDSLGFVHIKGVVKSGTINQPIFTLPAGYRPSANLVFAGCSANAHCRIDVNSTGTVVAVTGDNTWVSLEGITFRP